MGRYKCTYVEQYTDIKAKRLELTARLVEIKKIVSKSKASRYTVATLHMAEIRKIKSDLASLTKYRRKMLLSYRKTTATPIESDWFTSNLTIEQFKSLVTKLSPKRKERMAAAAPVVEKVSRNGITYTRVNGVITLGEIKKQLYNSNRYYSPKKPKNMEHHVGVELEMMLGKCTRVALGDKLTDYPLYSVLDITSDGSLRTNNGTMDTAELRVIDRQSNIKKSIDELCEMLKADSIKAEVDKLCGLHVHLDMRRRIVYDSYNNLVKSLPFLTQLVPTSRYYVPTGTNYCKINKLTDVFNSEQKDGSGDRYWAINSLSLSKHKTLEVRLHHGSVNATEINNWIDILTHIVDAPLVTGSIAGWSDFFRIFKIDNELASYIMKTDELYKEKDVVNV